MLMPKKNTNRAESVLVPRTGIFFTMEDHWHKAYHRTRD